jgi:RNA polymerase-binding transcription factor DksA
MDSDAARQLLEEERERLSNVRDGLDAENPSDETENQSMGELSDVDQHQADVGTETFEREKDYSILERVEAELGDVEHALRRLDEGTYGTCEACGKPIDDERLQAMPATRFCMDDQQLAEREARAGGQGA